MAQNYTSQNIQVLEELDAVRLRPGMYIGSTGSRGLHHLLWEIVDNAVDEAANNFATEVAVTLHNDGSASVWDNGRGVPVDKHPTLNISGIELIYTKLHAGGKFDHENYSYSGGLHGVGASVVNALSRWMVVESFRDWTHWRIRFETTVDPKTKKVKPGHPASELERVGNTRKRGTLVRFLPDDDIFEETSFNGEQVQRRLRELAYLNRGITVRFTDERAASPHNQTKVFQYEGGIVDYVSFLNTDKTVLHDGVILLEGTRDNLMMQAAIQFTDSYTESLFSYVNNIPTAEGGTHEVGFRTALTRAFNDYARKIGALKEKDNNLSGEDYREGMTAVLAVKVVNPQFEGQTKGRLGNTEVRPMVEALTLQKLGEYLEDLRNAAVAQKIIEKSIKSAKVREAARKARDVARTKSELEAAPLVGKLSSSTGRNPRENELFIVEGDSAGGSAKQGRDRRFQAILPLRGKPLNVEKKRIDQVLANEEFRSIITALGTNIDRDFNIDSLKYHKVIILSDADQDGAHIRAILLTFFYRYMRELITEGHVYIGMPPLYLIKYGNKEIYAYDDKELTALLPKGKNYTLQRYKGLGEMNPDQLWHTTMDPASRKLTQVTIEDGAESERLITILMGDKVEPRREYISQHANFNKPDTFLNRQH
ncbi:MAG TPA: DNA topoisomerase subunit B [Clostridia bacterium]|jgi:DNA gyrase subunit B|nr:DNA topoisomerase subunit B [Clostridia bacterium]HQO56481.1 DNA topoisomerase subunit B [Clostridia bacterium]